MHLSIISQLTIIQNNNVFLFGANAAMAKLLTLKCKHLKGELVEHWKQLTDLQHDWDFQAGVKFNNLERCFGVQMQNRSLPWREFCELIGDTGIYSSQVSSFAGGCRYLYSSTYKIGKCPRSRLFP